ncbi:28720_t:CDS:2, partial [Dentiscutata erythropus]
PPSPTSSTASASTTTSRSSARAKKLKKARGILDELLTVPRNNYNDSADMININIDEYGEHNANGLWYKFAEKYENKLNEILNNKHVAIKTAKSQVYKEIIKHLHGLNEATL